MSPLPKNTFYDINKLPKEYGILVFPISMSRATTSQAPNKYLSFLRHFSPGKITDSKMGVHVIYGDYLYLHSKEKAKKLRDTYMKVVIDHKNGFRNIVRKHRDEFQIQHGFSFQVWNDQYIQFEGDFHAKFVQFKRLALKDEKMMKYLKDDAKEWKVKLTKEQIDFFLEEHLMFQFISKGWLRLPNDYVQDRQEWTLIAYPGRQPKALIYAYQKNYFKLSNGRNIYENCVYDLSVEKLIDFNRIDLDTYNYNYEN